MLLKHINVVIIPPLPFSLRLPRPRPSLDLRGCGSTYHPTLLCRDRHNDITLLWSCCSLTHDHTDPWMGISAGFSKPNICASQHCHCSNHSLNQNTKSNFTWMPQHKYLIMAENKSLSFCTPFLWLQAPLMDPPRLALSLLFGYRHMLGLVIGEMELMNFLERFIAAIRPG